MQTEFHAPTDACVYHQHAFMTESKSIAHSRSSQNLDEWSFTDSDADTRMQAQCSFTDTKGSTSIAHSRSSQNLHEWSFTDSDADIQMGAQCSFTHAG